MSYRAAAALAAALLFSAPAGAQERDCDRQAVLMGTIRESDEPTVLVARLGIRSRTVAEIETLVIRDRAVAERLDAIGEPRG